MQSTTTDESEIVQACIPVMLIGGYLGAGKTTLLQTLVAEHSHSGMVVLVNDFGQLSIDANLIASAGIDTVTLDNGCICCSIGSSLTSTLLALGKKDPPPTQVIIEASGVSDPARIVDLITLSRRFRCLQTVVLVDASSIDRRLHDRHVGEMVRQQMQCADLLVLNRCDEASDEQRMRLSQPGVLASAAIPILMTSQAKIDTARWMPEFYAIAQHARTVGDVQLCDGSNADERQSGWPRCSTQPPLDDAAFANWVNTTLFGLPVRLSPVGHVNQPELATRCIAFAEPLDEGKLASIISLGEPDIVRAKGLVTLRSKEGAGGESIRLLDLQFASGRWQWRDTSLRGSELAVSILVLIGPGDSIAQVGCSAGSG